MPKDEPYRFSLILRDNTGEFKSGRAGPSIATENRGIHGFCRNHIVLENFSVKATSFVISSLLSMLVDQNYILISSLLSHVSD